MHLIEVPHTSAWGHINLYRRAASRGCHDSKRYDTGTCVLKSVEIELARGAHSFPPCLSINSELEVLGNVDATSLRFERVSRNSRSLDTAPNPT